MIVEHEIIEQIEDEPIGRPLLYCVDLALRLGSDDPMATIREMWRAGYLAVADAQGERLLDWQIAEIWRAGVAPPGTTLLATDLGSKWANG